MDFLKGNRPDERVFEEKAKGDKYEAKGHMKEGDRTMDYKVKGKIREGECLGSTQAYGPAATRGYGPPAAHGFGPGVATAAPVHGYGVGAECGPGRVGEPSMFDKMGNKVKQAGDQISDKAAQGARLIGLKK